jgi:hypothetical protein
MFRKLIPVILVITLATMACGFSVTIPDSHTPGPTTTEEISIAAPDTRESVDLAIEFGAGELSIEPGAEGLVEGTATYNIEEMRPVIDVSGNNVEITQRDWDGELIGEWDEVENRWDLKLGEAPMDLSIQAGAYQGEYELGGLSLTGLTIKDGAADVELNFSSPNLVEMDMLRYETGASSVTLSGLANANFSSLEFNGGAGDYTLDFSGDLQRDANVAIQTGVSNLTLIIPDDLDVRITVEGGLSNVSYGSGWDEEDNVYTQTGSGPTLTIVIEIGAGNLNITH